MQTMLPLFLSIYSSTALISILNNIPLGQSSDSDSEVHLWYSPSMIDSDSQETQKIYRSTLLDSIISHSPCSSILISNYHLSPHQRSVFRLGATPPKSPLPSFVRPPRMDSLIKGRLERRDTRRERSAGSASMIYV
jgi:hypothetical protein